MTASTVSIKADGRHLQLKTPTGTHRFHAIWLRDNALDRSIRDAGNGQRLITMKDLPPDPRILKTSIKGDQLRATFSPDDRTFDYPIGWLLRHAYDTPFKNDAPHLPNDADGWDSKLSTNMPVGHFRDLQTDPTALCAWLAAIRRFGFAKVTGMDGQSGDLFDIVKLFGFVRETNYGRHFEVRTEVNPTNLAFTGLGLQAHTDNPYRDPAPTLQILSCLENSATGSENMVVDGFQCALRLWKEDPEGFDLLSKYPARFSYVGENDVNLTSTRPMIELTSDNELRAIRFNSRSIAPLTDVPFDVMERYYAAYRRLSDIIDDTNMEITFKLAPGEAFIVDNTRVLHARKGYSGSGHRWLQGCYADKDGLLSKLRVLESELETSHGPA